MKYMGSKAKIAKYIMPIILKEKYAVYIEPFCGGCNTLSLVKGGLDEAYKKPMWISDYQIDKIGADSNKYLIAMWQGLQKDKKRPYVITKEMYNDAREDYNNKTNENYSDFMIGWIGFMASFNGRFFDGGYSGKSGGRDYIAEQIRNTEKQIPLIKDTKFYHADYDTTFATCSFLSADKRTIYCDPPYKGTKQYANSKDFDYEKFYNMCRWIGKSPRVNLFISEYWMPEDFKCVWEMEVTNSMHPTNTKKPVEKLFTI